MEGREGVCGGRGEGEWRGGGGVQSHSREMVVTIAQFTEARWLSG